MFPALRAEMARENVRVADLAAAVGVRPATMSLKMNRKFPFTLEEAILIKARLRTGIPIEDLFVWEER